MKSKMCVHAFGIFCGPKIKSIFALAARGFESFTCSQHCSIRVFMADGFADGNGIKTEKLDRSVCKSLNPGEYYATNDHYMIAWPLAIVLWLLWDCIYTLIYVTYCMHIEKFGLISMDLLLSHSYPFVSLWAGLVSGASGAEIGQYRGIVSNCSLKLMPWKWQCEHITPKTCTFPATSSIYWFRNIYYVYIKSQ